MKYYSQNRNTPSRSFYVNELKKKPKNLKNKNDRLDFLENNLNKLLTYSFKFFHPFFNDEEYEANKNYYKTTNNVDEDFDQKAEKHLPNWLLTIIAFFNDLYNRITGTKVGQNLIMKIRKTINVFNNTMLNKQILKTRKFFAFKSPP